MAPEEPGPNDAESRREELARQFEEILKPLSDLELEVIDMRFGMFDGQTHTLQETAEHFGLTPERISQIEANALRKIRHPHDDATLAAMVRW